MKKVRDEVMCIRIPADEKAQLKAIADAEDRSMTDVVLFLMRQGIGAYQSAKAPAPAKAAKPKAKAAKKK